MTDGVTVTGGWQLANQTAAVIIAGLDCGNYTIANDGSAFVPFGSDPDGLLTPSYLNSVSDARSTNPSLVSFDITAGSETITVYVPVLIGYAYASQGQLLRPETEQQVKSQQGSSIGKTRRHHRVAFQLTGAQGLAVGTDPAELDAVIFRDGGETQTTKDVLFTGVYQGDIDDSYSLDGMIAWSIARPYPCTITAVTGFLETQER